MKKFTSLLLLLLTMFLWGGVNAMAQTFTVSDAPSDGAWAKNTHWYTIKNKKGGTWYYLGTAATHTDAQDNLLIRSTDKTLECVWCVVKTGDNAYQFYNFAEGTGKVLGMTGDDALGRAKMYDAGIEKNGVWKTFYYNSTETKPDGQTANAFRISPTGTKYWNERESYLAFWNAENAVKSGCEGSAYVFEAVDADALSKLEEGLSTRFDNLSAEMNQYKENFKDHIGEIFSCSSLDDLNALSSAIPAQKPAETASLSSEVRKMYRAKMSFEASLIMPEVNKRYALRNYGRDGVRSDRYIYAPISLSKSEQLKGIEGLTHKCECWILEAGPNGTYRLKNAVTKSYIGGVEKDKAVLLSSGGANFNLYANDGGRIGTAKIGTGGQFTNLHLNRQNVLIGWETEEPTSWYFEEVSDEKFEELANDVNNEEVLKYMNGVHEMSVLADDVNATWEAFIAEPSNDEKAKAFINAVNASSYIRVKNVETGKYLGVSENGDVAHANEGNGHDVASIWKVEIVDESGHIKLHHLNFDKYLGALPGGASKTASMVDQNAGATWSFTKSGDSFVIKDGANAQMYNETNDNINNWYEGNRAKWYVSVATDIQVTLTTVNGKSYATTYLPFPVSAVEGAKAYVGTFNDAHTAITLTEKTEIPAKEGVVLISDDAAATATLTIGGNAVKEGTNAFSGTNTEITLSDKNRGNFRVLGPKASNPTLSIGFFRPSNSVASIPANRAYVEATSTSTASSVSVNFGTVEGLGSIVTETSEDANSPIYDLSGRRVMHTVKGGLYIRNGKKFLVK